MTHELFEELDAFNPRWREAYPSISAAASAAQCLGLYFGWCETPEGRKYLATIDGVPNYREAIKASQEAAERMPYGIGSRDEPQ